MSIEAWWGNVSPETREWLVSNNGDTIPGPIVAEIARAGGVIVSDAWWVGESGPGGFHLSDDAVDWIEAVANGETPQRQA